MAHSKSDPFIKLPPEMRLEVLTSIGCISTISRLIQASPIMLEQYRVHKMYIIRKVLDFDQDMMQDAMAIVLFPRLWRPGQKRLTKYRSKPIRKHIRKWSKYQLPDPLERNEDHLTSELVKLYNRIISYVEDYITKATAYYPPREYLCLPQIQEPSIKGHLMFKGAKVAPRFDSTRIASLEKSRFVKAFLMYMLMRKCNSLHYLPRMLSRRKISEAEEEAVFCIVSYFRSLYGAIFAQCNDDTWLPTNSSATSLETGLLFPDNFYFEADVYAPDTGPSGFQLRYHRQSFCDDLELLGPDRLTNWLRFDMGKEIERKALKLQLEQTKECPPAVWDSRFCLFKSGRKYNNGCESFMYQQLSLDNKYGLARKIGKQRAWVFFDNRRFYPEETAERPNFPSERFLIEQPSKQSFIEGWFNNPSKERALRRSQQWHDGLVNAHD